MILTTEVRAVERLALARGGEALERSLFRLQGNIAWFTLCSRQGSARAGRHHNALTTHDLLLHRGGVGRPPLPSDPPPLDYGVQTATRQALAQSRTHLQDDRLTPQRFTYHRSPLLPRLVS